MVQRKNRGKGGTVEMINLRDLLKLNQTVTLLDLYVRQPDGRLIRRSVIGEGYGSLSMYERRDLEDGKLERIDQSINIHFRPDSRGFSELSFGIIWKSIPKDYLEAEVTSVGQWRERYGNKQGTELHATIVPVQMMMEL